jgi:hypothetical protein
MGYDYYLMMTYSEFASVFEYVGCPSILFFRHSFMFRIRGEGDLFSLFMFLMVIFKLSQEVIILLLKRFDIFRFDLGHIWEIKVFL